MTYRIALSTIDSRERAEDLARLLLEARLVACVNILGPLTSLYHWQGKLACDAEYLLLMKTTALQVEALQKKLLEVHPYEVPEFLVIAIETGAAAYLDWLTASLAPRPRPAEQPHRQ